jgi:GWxTD domain-containing protein
MPSKPALVVIAFFAVAASSSLFGQPDPYTSWLDKDVRWIITLPERVAFESLKTDAEKDHFIVQFWERRDPTPGTPENEFKEEHYRRVAYANAQFASKTEGALTDRGAVYIKYGPPDEIVRNGQVQEPDSKADLSAKPPSQVWIYRALGKPPEEHQFKFVDSCACGEFQLKDEPVIYDPVR